MAVVIAECCQNHKGDLNILRDMVWAAADAGADYVKIQSMRAEELTRRDRFEQGVESNGVRIAIKRPWQPEYDRLKALDLDDEAHRWFIDECRRARIKPLTTAFTRGRVPFLASLPWKAIKVASYDCASFPLLDDLVACFEQLFVSTGATTDDEIREAARILSRRTFTLLHCVTIYPTPLDELNLARMQWLRRFSPSVGFSDHTLVARDGLKASMAAIALGADVVERHFSVLPAEATKDGPVSVSPEQLRELVGFARLPSASAAAYVERHIPESSSMVGQPVRSMSQEELLNRDYYRGRFATHVAGRPLYNWESGVSVS